MQPEAATAREVTCVTKHPQRDPYRGITHLGGRGWRMTRWQVTAAINSGGGAFYLRTDGKRANVQVVEDGGESYLRTVVDDQWTDDLLALPNCPTI